MSELDSLLPIQSSTVQTYPLGDEVLLYMSDTSAVHALNPPAAAIWQLCDGDHTVLTIVETLSRELDCSPSDLTDGIRTTIEQFREMGLLQT